MRHLEKRPAAAEWFRSERLVVRPLREEDIGPAYQSWFQDPAVRHFIRFAATAPSLASLREYWAAKATDPDVDFLGIFDAATGRHLGNMKFELGPARDEAHVGFLIGEPQARGTGVLRETLAPAVAELRRRRGPLRVYLTVNRGNHRALAAFERLGFRHSGAMPGDDLRMDYGGA